MPQQGLEYSHRLAAPGTRYFRLPWGGLKPQTLENLAYSGTGKANNIGNFLPVPAIFAERGYLLVSLGEIMAMAMRMLYKRSV